MAYTFGGATSDNVSIVSSGRSTMGASRAGLWCCWVYPTTLTATRVIFGWSATSRMAIDTTTTSVRVTIDAATTDGVWTAPMGFATNTWTFIAFLHLEGATSTDLRIWSGAPQEAPVERTVTNVTPQNGATTTATSTMTIGNTPSGSLSFQGDIGGVFWINGYGMTPFGFEVGVDTTISNAAAAFTYANFVDPIWRGDVGPFVNRGDYAQWETGGEEGWQWMASLHNPQGVFHRRTTGQAFTGGSGAFLSPLTPPKRWRDDPHPLIVERGGMRRMYQRPV